jgi:hypothetical protein
VDEKGVVHISKKPPPRSAELIDIMDYQDQIAPPATQKQPKDLNRTDAGKSGKASDKIDTGDNIEDDVYYDSGGDRYTRRERKQERKERRQEDGKDREKKGDLDPDRKDRYREDRQERKDEKKTERSERQEYLQKRKESKGPGQK